jgi:hypothetical protein
LGTGRPPGQHGIVGFTMHVPPVADVVECLTWMGYASGANLVGALPPERLQPFESLFAVARRQGVAASVVSLAMHVGGGLSRASTGGAVFDPIDSFADDTRLTRIRSRLDESDRALVYTYDARLDTAAHRDGIGSAAWRLALRQTDRLARELAADLSPRALLLVTADHGGLNVPAGARLDLVDRPELARDIAWLSGDPRARHVHALPGRADSLLDAWREGLGDGWLVLSRDEAVGSGLFGPAVREEVLPRIGDLVAIAVGDAGLFDRSRYPWEQRLVAFHGALSAREQKVPLLVAGG